MRWISKLFTKKQTARRTYIRLLGGRVSAIDSLTAEDRGHFLWAELIAAGYLNGVTRTGAEGTPTGNKIAGPTVSGRLFLQELEKQERDESFRGKIEKWGLVTGAYIFGAVTPILIEFVKVKLNLAH